MLRPTAPVLLTLLALLVLTIVLAGQAWAVESPPAPVCGDVNDSGSVSSADALLVLRSAVGQPVELACTTTCPSVGRYGISTELPETSGHTPDYLLGSSVEIPVSSTVTHLAVIAKEGGPNVRMALYTDVAGAPGALVVGTTPVPLVTGVQEIPVAATPVSAGNYWIMAIYDNIAAIAYSSGNENPAFKYRTLSFKDPLPVLFGKASQDSGQSFSYYVKVIQ